MISRDRVESYLVKLSLTFQEAGPSTWIVRDGDKGIENLFVSLTDSLVVFRVNVMELPAAGREKLFEQLLRLNASDMVHGAYAVDGQSVVIVDTLEAETMDLEEFQASIDAIGLALAQHYRVLAPWRARA
jgi:hypothetical protein